jgi:cytochrome c biogenesis protein CcmG/thiol:disulfide interchange protein DsbE
MLLIAKPGAPCCSRRVHCLLWNLSSRSYYKNVHPPRFIGLLLLLPLVLLPACNRGAPPQQPGEVAPDFTVSDGTTTVNLASYRGHVVLLNFWFSTCPPCIAELPSLLELHRDMPRLDIIAVSVDEDANTYKRFVTTHHVDLITVRNPSQSIPALYHTEAFPETYLIDRNGIIRYKFVSNQDWNNPEIRSMIKNLM